MRQGIGGRRWLEVLFVIPALILVLGACGDSPVGNDDESSSPDVADAGQIADGDSPLDGDGPTDVDGAPDGDSPLDAGELPDGNGPTDADVPPDGVGPTDADVPPDDDASTLPDGVSDSGDSDSSDGGPDDAMGVDVPTGPNACGGAGPLIVNGTASMPGDACGCDGVLACDGPDVLSCVSLTPANACGGCENLEFVVGRPCGGCAGRVWTCDGTDAVICTSADGSDCIEEICDNRADDDDDGLSDCGDPDCLDTPTCPLNCAGVVCDAPSAPSCDGNTVRVYSSTGTCRFGLGCVYAVAERISCGPENCSNGACVPAEDCASAGDEDGNGLADCADPVCIEETDFCIENCNEVGDEDGNGLADCADPVCSDALICYAGPINQCAGDADTSVVRELSGRDVENAQNYCRFICTTLTLPDCALQCIASELGLSPGCAACTQLDSLRAPLCSGVCAPPFFCSEELPDMVTISAGTFTMGSPSGELGRGRDETQHAVTLTRDFLMSRTEITQGQWATVMDTDPTFYYEPDLPVTNVSWWRALEFANRLSALEGLPACYILAGCSGSACSGVSVEAEDGNPYNCSGYRLPTEAEWEYAYRAGTTTAFYNGGITETECGLDPNLDAIGWYCGNTSTIREVGQKEPNAWNLYDMAGNVAEWTWDWYGPYPGVVTDPLGPLDGTARVRRGGSVGLDVPLPIPGLDVGEAVTSRAASRQPPLSVPLPLPVGLRLARTAP